MRRFLILGLLLSTQLYALELGAKLGNARINWKDNTDTTLEWYLALYGEHLFPLSPTLSVGPMVEIGYGKKNIGTFYCPGVGTCKVDLTYTTLEVNGKAILSITPILDLYGGGGISSNRFGIDAWDLNGNSVGTLGDETKGGAQAFVGAQLKGRGFGAGIEYKYKYVNTDSIDSVDAVTLSLFLSF